MKRSLDHQLPTIQSSSKRLKPTAPTSISFSVLTTDEEVKYQDILRLVNQKNDCLRQLAAIESQVSAHTEEELYNHLKKLHDPRDIRSFRRKWRNYPEYQSWSASINMENTLQSMSINLDEQLMKVDQDDLKFVNTVLSTKPIHIKKVNMERASDKGMYFVRDGHKLLLKKDDVLFGIAYLNGEIYLFYPRIKRENY